MTQMLTTTDIGKKLKVSSVTVHNRVASGDFPKPDKADGRKRLWKREKVDKWIAKHGDLIASMKRRSSRAVDNPRSWTAKPKFAAKTKLAAKTRKKKAKRAA